MKYISSNEHHIVGNEYYLKEISNIKDLCNYGMLSFDMNLCRFSLTPQKVSAGSGFSIFFF